MHTTSDSSEVIPFPSPALASDAPAPTNGYTNVRFNALKHGVLSKHTVLAHEDAEEFNALLSALHEEHRPSSPTEIHLIEELAGVMWRKRRVLQAEGASINRGLLAVAKVRYGHGLTPDGPARAAVPFEPSMAESRLNVPVELAEAMRENSSQKRKRVAEAEDDMVATRRALEILRHGGSRAYARALRALTPGSVDWWTDKLEDSDVSATAKDLEAFVAGELTQFCRSQLVEASSLDAIKAQTLGEGLQAHRLEKLNRYETHLDRKFERTLAMLLKLKELRRDS